MKKILVIFAALFTLCFAITAYAATAPEAVSAASDSNRCITYLFCGYDDAACNTDSIIIANYSPQKNSLAFVQIPRDTYYKTGNINKINSLFPTLLGEGKSKNDAMKSLTDAISRALGIRIDAYIAYSTSTFASLVDTIGGVSLDLPSDITISDSKGKEVLALKKGENHLSGKEALEFVRMRNEYKTGDLGRIDAQKLFLAAFVKKVKNNLSAMDVIRICMSANEGWILNAKIADFIKIAKINRGRLSNIETLYANVPGLALTGDSGVSYYSISKKPLARLLSDLDFDIIDEVDEEELLKGGGTAFEKIYYDTGIKYKIYNSDTLSEIDLSRR